MSFFSIRPMRRPTFQRGMVEILSTMMKGSDLQIFRFAGATATRANTVSTASLVKGQTVIETVASKSSL